LKKNKAAWKKEEEILNLFSSGAYFFSSGPFGALEKIRTDIVDIL